MLKAVKTRIYPNKEQSEKLASHFGAARWVWNDALAFKQKQYKEHNEALSGYTLKARLPILKKEYSWLKDAPSQSLQQSILNLDRAFRNFFARRARFPRFKSRRSKQSIQYPQGVKVEEYRIQLPKVGWVKAKVHRALYGRLKTVTVSKSATGKYYASLLFDTPEESRKYIDVIDKVIGVDLGITTLLTYSDGEKVDNPNHLKQATNNLTRKQRNLSRKKKGSTRRSKARLLVAKAHEKVANRRHDFQHKVTRRLADENQAVIIEDLAVGNRIKNHCLAKAIADAGWGELNRKLAYKLEWTGGRLAKVGRFYPSSKTCSDCGFVVKKLPLNIRRWKCECGVLHDRDVNAAINIRDEGIRILKAAGLSVSASGGLRKTGTLSAAA